MARLAEVATIRPWGEEDDANFVYGSWLNSWRGSRYAGVIPNNLYYEVTHTAIEELVARGAVVLVAEWKGELLAFACGEAKDGKKVVHYIYCKDPFLGHGLEERLLAELPGESPGWFTFAQNRFLKDRQWKHAPEMARRLVL